MPDEQTTPDAGYIKGFNEGYIIAKHMPELSDCIVQARNESLRLEGFRDGRKQLVLEKIATQGKTPVKTDSDKGTRPAPTKDRDLEPDR